VVKLDLTMKSKFRGLRIPEETNSLIEEEISGKEFTILVNELIEQSLLGVKGYTFRIKKHQNEILRLQECIDKLTESAQKEYTKIADKELFNRICKTNKANMAYFILRKRLNLTIDFAVFNEMYEAAKNG